MDTLKAEKRTKETKAKKLRREGYVTGNVIGKDIETSIPVKMEKKAVDQLLKSNGKGSRIVLDIDGQTKNVLIKEVIYNSLKKAVEEISFQSLIENEKVRSVAEVVILNHEVVEAGSGVLEQLLEEIPYTAYPSALVDKVEVDVAGLHVGESIKVKDLSIAKDPEIGLHIDPEAAVVTLSEARSAVAATETEEEEEDGES